MWRIVWLILWMFILLLIGTGCAAIKTTLGMGAEDVHVRDIGGGGDSVALWLAIGALTILALGIYPAQRGARLVWRSLRGKSDRPGKGRETCVKHSEWDS